MIESKRLKKTWGDEMSTGHFEKLWRLPGHLELFQKIHQTTKTTVKSSSDKPWDLAGVKPTVWDVTLSVIGLIAAIKARGLQNTLKKNNDKNKIQLHAVCKTHFRFRDKNRMKVNGWKKIFRGNSNQRRSEMVMLSDKVGFKIKIVTRDKDGHVIMVTSWIHWEACDYKHATLYWMF